MRLVFKKLLFLGVVGLTFITNAQIYKFKPETRLPVKISKSGLNRISNPPYKIMQIIGDNSQFKIKYDEDGSNIYFMPLVNVGENIEISLKNNAGHVQDLELIVSNIKGKSIIIDGKTKHVLKNLKKSDITQMLRAMKDNVESKFYVQQTNQLLNNIGVLKVKQIKTYKYKDLIGGVFEVTNPSKSLVKLQTSIFADRFKEVRSFYPSREVIYPKQTILVLIIQEIKGSMV